MSKHNGMRNLGKIVSFTGLHAEVKVTSCVFTGLVEQYDGCNPALYSEFPEKKPSLNNFRQLFNADKEFASY